MYGDCPLQRLLKYLHGYFRGIRGLSIPIFQGRFPVQGPHPIVKMALTRLLGLNFPFYGERAVWNDLGVRPLFPSRHGERK